MTLRNISLGSRPSRPLSLGPPGITARTNTGLSPLMEKPYPSEPLATCCMPNARSTLHSLSQKHIHLTNARASLTTTRRAARFQRRLCRFLTGMRDTATAKRQTMNGHFASERQGGMPRTPSARGAGSRPLRHEAAWAGSGRRTRTALRQGPRSHHRARPVPWPGAPLRAHRGRWPRATECHGRGRGQTPLSRPGGGRAVVAVRGAGAATRPNATSAKAAAPKSPPAHRRPQGAERAAACPEGHPPSQNQPAPLGPQRWHAGARRQTLARLLLQRQVRPQAPLPRCRRSPGAAGT